MDNNQFEGLYQLQEINNETLYEAVLALGVGNQIAYLKLLEDRLNRSALSDEMTEREMQVVQGKIDKLRAQIEDMLGLDK